MGYKFYKWVMIIALVLIGILRFFDLSTTNRIIIDAFLYVIAIISAIFYLREKFKAKDK